MNIRRIIKEELLKETGGYDDLTVMGIHAGQVMDTLSSSYNDLTNTLQGLANAIVDGSPKMDLAGYLIEASNEIDVLIDVIQIAIKDFTEDDLIAKAQMVIKALNTFRKKIDILSRFNDAMGNDIEFIERVKTLLMDLIPSLQEYGEQLRVTNKMFGDRLSGMNRGAFGSGFSSN